MVGTEVWAVSPKKASVPLPYKTVLLYPKGQDTDYGVAGGPLTSNGLLAPEGHSDWGFINNVGDSARMDLYFPQKPNGQMIVICPGGGYSQLSALSEGILAAKWLLSKHISVCVLKYRMPQGKDIIPITDVRNTFRYCRDHQKEWGIDQIGIMGGSAGGHLAAVASTQWMDELTRPDFTILLYPVITMTTPLTDNYTCERLIGKNPSAEKIKQYSAEKNVNSQTPPTFIAVSKGDNFVSCDNSRMYYDSLRVHGVKAELHIYPCGIHGWGFLDREMALARNSGQDFGFKDISKITYTDQLGPYRKDFYKSLSKWLKQVHRH